MKAKKNVLVTGDAGFIGTHLQKRLLKENSKYNVFGYDIERGEDVRDAFLLEKRIRENNIDVVVHLAARAGVHDSKHYPDEYITTNIIGTNNVVEACKRNKVEHLVFFSSSSVYGNGKSPLSDNPGVILKPISLYGMTKLAGELIVENSGLNWTIVRPFTVYGERGRKEQVIYKWLEQFKSGRPITYYSGGKEPSKRGYTYVGDLIDGVISILEKKPYGNVYNLGGNEIVPLDWLLSIFNKCVTGKLQLAIAVETVERISEDIKESWADISKARRELGFNPNTNFEEKVSEIIQSEINKL